MPSPYDTIVFNGGTITLTSTVTIHGQFNWSGGTLTGGALTVASDGVLNLSGGGVNLAGALTNAGTVNWTSGTLAVCCAGPIVNLAGALWDIQCDQTLCPTCCLSPSFQFQNAGTVRKSAGSGTTCLQIPFYNAGTVIALQGTLSFQSGGTVDGSYNALAGAAIKFISGDFVGGAAPVLNGPGPIQFTGGTLTLSSSVIANLQMVGGTLVLGPNFQGGTITNLTLSGVTLSGTNTVSGTLDWLAGTVSGPLTVAQGAVLNLGGTYVSSGSTLTNAGTVNWTSGTLAVCCAGPIVNLAGALWDIQCDQTLCPTCCLSPSFQFQNAGTVRKSAGSGTTYLQIPFYNSGTLSLLSGSVNFNQADAYAQTGATLDFGLSGAGRTTPLQVIGNLSLNGTLSASLLNNYAPKPGDTIPLISCGALTNSFNWLDLPVAGSNLGWRIVYAANAVSLQVVPIANLALQCELTGGNLVLSWPAAIQGVYLQTTATLSEPGSWTTVTNTSIVVNEQVQVTAPRLPGTHFYRLRKP